MIRTLGVSIYRRSVCLVSVERTGTSLSISQNHRIERSPGLGPGQALQAILTDQSAASTRLAIALSPSDLACADAWILPQQLRAAGASRIGPAICESRCASETLESMEVDTSFAGSIVQAAALDRGLLDELLQAAGPHKIALITPITAALAAAFGTAALTQGGERIEVDTREGVPSWRAYPVDQPDEPGSLTYKGLQVAAEHAAAFAAAVCDPESVPNLLNALPQYRKTFAKRYRDPLLSVAAAAALCFGALAIHFHRDAVRERQELAAARSAELQLWARYLPSQVPREGRLLKALRDRLNELGETPGNVDFPSALAFWGEIGRQMPDPEALGITLESLDLAPDGGRISARIPAVKEDPLKNASQLEAKLNDSKKMTARGDYEVRDGQVQVRLRMDYKP